MHAIVNERSMPFSNQMSINHLSHSYSFLVFTHVLPPFLRSPYYNGRTNSSDAKKNNIYMQFLRIISDFLHLTFTWLAFSITWVCCVCITMEPSASTTDNIDQATNDIGHRL